ncbi:protein-export membrane protein SecD [Pseudofulvimonas gallinarii]|jgi:preprotein translocase subunit SecD|uniref:Protein translocase subunit SecD n=2 Tax=Pseudofulvimonas gallinarii TaxID=634155 RepID=A0A4R3LMF8_9GAMM|nr:protein translocase subunit SecD [Pseudofulvimonas gallinarii]TCT01201.1 preprotein translocase subunit SecD [Pseudofulvimonas gallinarii]THD14967.1 protein-export membrane protein SecD [Pseudofulvimonas gallinarii]
MMNYPKWKYALVVLVMLVAAFYAAPNLYPEDPAIQISANRGSVVDEAFRERVHGILESRQLPFTRLEMADGRLMAHFANTDVQLRASEVLREELGEDYTSALNLASTVPGWLAALGGKSMVMGLDLQGGIHFTMEVDQRATQERMENRFVEDIRVLLRERRIRYKGVSRGAQGSLSVVLRSSEDREAALNAISSQLPELVLTGGAGGGEDWVLEARISEAALREAALNAVEQNLSTLRNRVDELGTSEPVIQRQGESRIVVQLPGVQDTAAAKRILGATATLEYRAVDESVNPLEVAETGRVPPQSELFYHRQGYPVVLSKRIIASGDQLVSAASGFAPDDGSPMVSVRLNSAGARRMLDFTNENVGKGMAVVFVERVPEVRTVNGEQVRSSRIKREVISVATVREPFGRTFQTSGLDSAQEASELALLLKAGALAAPIDIVEERVIGPSLGQENIDRGVKAIVLGLLCIMAFVAIYYRAFGLITCVTLVLNLVLLLAILSIIGATLTMPGIAGIMLTLGMAVDANVLICERIRSELRLGNTPLGAIKGGYDKAWTSILDANLTTLLAGIALFSFGSGPIRGFAVTMCIGILTSMFTAVTVSEAIAAFVYGRRRKLKSISI